ncbi:MAG TPA: DUF2934 domain-containing protein [Planctomycetes bacterium]|nr:DUF2934 domain-containing protein [Planctomycetota bacterium]
MAKKRKDEKQAVAAGKDAPERPQTSPASGQAKPPVDHVAVAAYFRWQKRGGKHGGDMGDWLEAEKEFGKK